MPTAIMVRLDRAGNIQETRNLPPGFELWIEDANGAIIDTLTPIEPAEVCDYIKSGGTNCPNCGSADIEGSSVTIDGGSATQRIDCMACDHRWFDVYQLVGIDSEGDPS